MLWRTPSNKQTPVATLSFPVASAAEPTLVAGFGEDRVAAEVYQGPEDDFGGKMKQR